MIDPDRFWMRRALAEAGRGRGYVEPNPMVGAVVVRDGRPVGVGFDGTGALLVADDAGGAVWRVAPADGTAIPQPVGTDEIALAAATALTLGACADGGPVAPETPKFDTDSAPPSLCQVTQGAHDC